MLQMPDPTNGEIFNAEMRKRTERFPKLFQIWFGFFHPTTFLVHSSTVKQILKLPGSLVIFGPTLVYLIAFFSAPVCCN